MDESLESTNFGFPKFTLSTQMRCVFVLFLFFIIRIAGFLAGWLARRLVWFKSCADKCLVLEIEKEIETFKRTTEDHFALSNINTRNIYTIKILFNLKSSDNLFNEF